MTKWHLVLATPAARPVAHVVGRALCGIAGAEHVVHTAEEFRGRIGSEQCQRCAEQLDRLLGELRRTA